MKHDDQHTDLTVNVETPTPGETCHVASQFVMPHLNRLDRDVSAAHAQLRAHDVAMEKMVLWREESTRRLEFLEFGQREQQAESRRSAESFSKLSNKVELVDQKLDAVTSLVMSLTTKFDEHGIQMVEKFEHETERHQRLMRIGMTLASSVGGLIAILGGLLTAAVALHSAATGAPLIESIGDLVKGLFA
jgi:hypothetical protein